MEQSFWNRFAFVYDLATRSGERGITRAADYIVSHLSDTDRVLDAACGTGAFACAIAPHVSRVMATDYSPQMVRQTRRKAARRGLTNVRCKEADILYLPTKGEPYDAAVAGNVLHLLDNPQLAIDEIRRVVKPGGIIALPNYVQPESGSRHLIGSLIELAGFSPASEWDRETFLSFVEGSGLELVEHRSFDAFKPLCVAICRA